MNIRQRKAYKALAAFLVFAVAQVYVQISFAGPAPGNTVLPVPQQFIATLRVRGNASITVNGNSATTGASIVTGATIETTDQSATIHLGSIGDLDIAPNTKLVLDYDNHGNVRVRLITGCAILRTKKNTNGEIVTDQGSAGKTNNKSGGILDVCFPPGSNAPLVNQGAAAAAGAGAGAGTTTAAAGAGISGALLAAIIGGGAALVIGLAVAFRGSNPSPSR